MAAREGSSHGLVRFTRLAEQIADDLRNRILVGDLSDGSELPIEEELRAMYPVSKPTLREAMRVLEAEGLVTVRRGSVGGAVVHRPTAEHVAYSLGLVLAGRKVDIGDIGIALRAVEPACAEACAQRADRNEVVVPVLKMLHERAIRAVGDLVEVTTLSRMFHEAIVELCGNESLSILAGALESLWSSHESTWANRDAKSVNIPRKERLHALGEHLTLIEQIADGDAAGARETALKHLEVSQGYPRAGERAGTVSPDAVRARFIERTS
ncbi:GntR family transcriptional regulator [Rhodococcus sp. OK519]|uniref:FadR/GntR family transcriptional regulator n=1 Tax=Rhodococcus sp. OK519 TaxID=2135729 RepID=UPI000D3CF33B|nr:GntR family transcriptional regulator [Rhodococcus sp. OK519]